MFGVFQKWNTGTLASLPVHSALLLKKYSLNAGFSNSTPISLKLF